MNSLKLLLSDVAWPDTIIEQQLCDEAGVELVIASDSSEESLSILANDCDGIITCWADTVSYTHLTLPTIYSV